MGDGGGQNCFQFVGVRRGQGCKVAQRLQRQAFSDTPRLGRPVFVDCDRPFLLRKEVGVRSPLLKIAQRVAGTDISHDCIDICHVSVTSRPFYYEFAAFSRGLV